MPTRDEVYKAIDSERKYQNKWDEKRKENPSKNVQMDADKPIESWIAWMEEYLATARAKATADVDKITALHFIRKVTALGVACMEYLGAPVREEEG